MTRPSSTRVELVAPGDGVTAVPYMTPGDPNRRFIDLRAHPEQIDLIGELHGRPALREQIELLNRPDSPLFTIGCERALSRLREQDGSPVWKCSSYVQFAFVHAASCEITSYEPLVRALHKALDSGADSDSSDRLVELEPDPIVFQPAGRRAWSLTIWTHAYAQDGDTAVHEWSLCMMRQTTVIGSWIRLQDLDGMVLTRCHREPPSCVPEHGFLRRDGPAGEQIRAKLARVRLEARA